MASMFHPEENTVEHKMHSPERELVIRPIEGQKTLNSVGVVDTRLWKGGNSIRALMSDTGLWYFKQESGLLPDALKVQFTSITKLIKFAKDYFSKRNLEVVEVKDIHHGS